MKKLIFLMSKFGATFLPKNKFKFPLKFISSEMPVGINYRSDVSAQLKSAVIFAGLNSYGNTKIYESRKSRNHTENMLRKNKNTIKTKDGNTNFILISGKKELEQIKIKVPGDPSSAAFFTALTLLNSNSSLRINSICLNETRIGFYNLLKKQGAKIKFKNLHKENNELKGDVLVQVVSLNQLQLQKILCKFNG